MQSSYGPSARPAEADAAGELDFNEARLNTRLLKRVIRATGQGLPHTGEMKTSGA